MKSSRRWGGGLCLVVALAGCGQLGKSAEERIALAMPVAADTQAAKDAVDQAAAEHSAEAERFAGEYQARLKIRSLECAHGYTPSAFASEADIREALTDQACFDRFDQGLAQWLGWRRVGLLLAAPPLRPVPDNPASLLVAEAHITEVAFAARAGVGLLQWNKGYQVMDLADAAIIHRGQHAGPPLVQLSPNGRLFVAGEDGQTVVHEAETGRAVARLEGPWLSFQWVGEVGAMYRPAETAEPVYLDLASGVETKVPFGSRIAQVVAATDGSLRFVLLGSNRVGVMQLTPSPQGFVPALVEETRLAETALWARNTSGLNGDGSLFIGATQSLALLDTRTLQLRTLPFAPLRLGAATATPDPDRLHLAAYFRNAPGAGPQSLLYSISRGTLAPVLVKQLLSPRVIFIPVLNRNAVLDGAKVALVEQLPAGVEQEANAYLVEHGEAARVAAEARMASYSGLQEQWARAALAGRAQPGADIPKPGAPTDARLAALAANADIEAVGVYEGGGIGQARGASARTGTVQVSVARSPRPIVLSLSSYEPVRWVITLEPGAKVAAVLQSGYYPAEVFGAGDARIYNLGRLYAYKRGSPEFQALSSEVRQWTGKGIDTFQGTYTGSSFRVGGR